MSEHSEESKRKIRAARKKYETQQYGDGGWDQAKIESPRGAISPRVLSSAIEPPPKLNIPRPDDLGQKKATPRDLEKKTPREEKKTPRGPSTDGGERGVVGVVKKEVNKTIPGKKKKEKREKDVEIANAEWGVLEPSTPEEPPVIAPPPAKVPSKTSPKKKRDTSSSDEFMESYDEEEREKIRAARKNYESGLCGDGGWDQSKIEATPKK